MAPKGLAPSGLTQAGASVQAESESHAGRKPDVFKGQVDTGSRWVPLVLSDPASGKMGINPPPPPKGSKAGWAPAGSWLSVGNLPASCSMRGADWPTAMRPRLPAWVLLVLTLAPF